MRKSILQIFVAFLCPTTGFSENSDSSENKLVWGFGLRAYYGGLGGNIEPNIKDNFAASVGFGIATISGFGDGLNVLFGGKYYLQNYIKRGRFSLQASYSYKARCSML